MSLKLDIKLNGIKYDSLYLYVNRILCMISCLLAVNNIEGIKKKYYIQGIPHAILVHPGGEMDVVDLFKDRLYSIVE